MFCMTLIIGIVHTLLRLTVNADRTAGMFQRTCIGIISLLRKALTACIVTTIRVFAAYHDIPFAAALILIVRTVFHTTF